MILEEIRLEHFRCFFGSTSIRFSTDPGKNVTVIYAENGVGKTTLLNALLWCFYGETTSRFEKREDILNHEAKESGHSTATVEVLFQHNENSYIATRLSNLDSSTGQRFVVARIDEGAQIPLHAPATFINTVIPRDMAAHFLFDGEHAEDVLGERNTNLIKSAVRDILGCSLIETAIEDLNKNAEYFRKQIPSAKATQRNVELNEHLEELNEQIEEYELKITKSNKEVERTEQQIADIDLKLRNTDLAKQLQEDRDRLSADLVRAQRKRKDQEDEVYRWLGEEGRFIVSKKITEETFSFLNEKEHRGQIPSPYNEEFVNDLLEAQECICGAELKPGSPETQRVTRLREKASNQVMRDRITKVRARLTNLMDGRLRSPERLIKAKKSLSEAAEEIGRIESRLGEISVKLKGIDTEEIAEREQRRSELNQALKLINQEIGRLKTEVSSDIQKKSETEMVLTSLANQDKQTEIYSQRLSLCRSIVNQLESQLETEETQAREFLRHSIGQILEATARKILRLQMTDDYAIGLVNSEGTVLAKSSGENQLLGLAFTAALVEYAKDRSGSKDYRLLPGTIAPLVLDSPFGQLDSAYRMTTVEYIPKMARQVILLVSKSQGSKDVLDVLEPHLGAEYALVRYNKEPSDGRKVEKQSFKDKVLNIVVFDAKFEGTIIEEISRI